MQWTPVIFQIVPSGIPHSPHIERTVNDGDGLNRRFCRRPRHLTFSRNQLVLPQPIFEVFGRRLTAQRFPWSSRFVGVPLERLKIC